MVRSLFVFLFFFSVFSVETARARVVTEEEAGAINAELERFYLLRAEIIVKYVFNSPSLFNMDMYGYDVYEGESTFIAARESLAAWQTYFDQSKEAVLQAEQYFEGVVSSSSAPDSYKNPYLSGFKEKDGEIAQAVEDFFASDQAIINAFAAHLDVLQRSVGILTVENEAYCFPGHEEIAAENDGLVDQLEALFNKRGEFMLFFSNKMPGFNREFKELPK